MSEPTHRCVWLSHADVSWLHTSEDTPQRREALTRLNIGFNTAPADPVEAVEKALADAGWNRIPRPTLFALRALGWDAPA